MLSLAIRVDAHLPQELMKVRMIGDIESSYIHNYMMQV